MKNTERTDSAGLASVGFRADVSQKDISRTTREVSGINGFLDPVTQLGSIVLVDSRSTEHCHDTI